MDSPKALSLDHLLGRINLVGARLRAVILNSVVLAIRREFEGYSVLVAGLIKATVYSALVLMGEAFKWALWRRAEKVRLCY